MPEIVKRLVMVTPFHSNIANLPETEQLLMLNGCVLCAITRDLARGSVRSKAEWKECKAELGVPIDVSTIDKAEPRVLETIDRKAPAVCAETTGGQLHLLLAEDALAQCKGSVRDFRGRILFRLAALDLVLP
jgi:hypothetical protein